MSHTSDMAELIALLRRFISGEDRTQAFVRGDIGDLLESRFPEGEGFPDRETYEDLETAVGCYRPGGGQFLYNEDQTATIFAAVAARLQSAGTTDRAESHYR